MELVSIVVPVYNIEKYIGNCVKSIQKQTYENIEVICVNDGSQDGTLNIINSFAKRDSRVVVIDKTNSGYGASVNLGISKAKGEYVGIIESDDYVDPGMIEELVKVACLYELDVAKAGFYVTFESNETQNFIPHVPDGKVVTPLEETNIFFSAPAIWSGLYLRKFLIDNDIRCLETPGASYQDTSFNFKCNLMCKRFMAIHKCFVHYRQHEQNSVKSSGKVYAICEEYDEIVSCAIKNKKFSSVVKDLILRLLMKGYRWNFKRLPWGASKIDFVHRWSLDLRRMRRIGVMPQSRFGLGLKETVDYGIILRFPALFVLKYKMQDFLKRKKKV